MDTDKLNVKDLSLYETKELNGGVWWLLPVAMYLLYETAADPVGSWNAFKKGWNSI